MQNPAWTLSQRSGPVGAPRWRSSGWAASQRAYVAGYNAGLAKANVATGPITPLEIREAWRRGWREGDAAARTW